ncbi:hypothetical protein LMG7974_01417 [Campylobacter majalis]|uniref:Uncharacterized protein n=1 Tax=Campylobacter majalis TaxID=2790656 RepID=A0ABN7KC16_9BACT|nr:hypothetical protein [Campylobacter majalis]CAD7289253.1 hypothetical protein LMG7974_01417 [Campylobacter majalis]
MKDEIEKIHIRIPKWFKNPNQINSKILITFMRLSNCNQIPVSFSTLEKHCNLKTFKQNFAQMVNISQKNHGKVFNIRNDSITLWDNVSEFIILEFNKFLK